MQGCRLQAEFSSVLLHSGQAVANVIFYRDAEEFGAAGDVLALDGAGEGFVLELFADTGDFDLGDGA